jgi:hypothetical protein
MLLEHAKLNFKGRDALVLQVGLETGLLRGGGHAIRRRHPAIAVAKQHQHEGTAALDFIQTTLSTSSSRASSVPSCAVSTPSRRSMGSS